MNKIAILGPGLLGGSLALALRARVPGCRVAVWARREAAVEEVRAAGFCEHASAELAPVVEGADLIVFCVPIGAMPGLARQIAGLVKPDALITDVGSVKAPVVEALVPIFEESGRGHFIGSHPMAGSEQAGLSAARADLFEGTVSIVTPHEGASPESLKRVREFWQLVGCEVKCLGPEEHDATVGLVSHLPHLLAAALTQFVCTQNAGAVDFCGNGLRDTTRIAAGLPEMWTEILSSNRSELGKQLDGLIAQLQEISRDLAIGNDSKVKEFLTRAKVLRDQHIKPRS